MTDASSAELKTETPLGEPGSRVTATPREWKDRVGSMSKAMVKQLTTDDRLSLLGFDSFGLLMRIHMLTRAGRCLPEDAQSAARLLNTNRRRLDAAMDELKCNVPDLLVLGNSGYTAPTLIGEHARPTPELSAKRRDAALSKVGNTKITMKIQGARRSRQRRIEPFLGFGFDQDLAQPALFEESELPGVAAARAKEGIPDCPFDELASMYNAIDKLPKVRTPQSWTAARRDNTRNRWRQHHTLEFWADVFARVGRSDFLTGVSSKWRADYDWIIKPSNLQKILEGNYENHRGGKRELWGNGSGSSTGTETAMRSRVDAPFMKAAAPAPVAAAPAAPAVPQRPVGASRVDMSAPFMRKTPEPAAPSQPAEAPGSSKPRIAFRSSPLGGGRA
jgi:hypothetical protein